MELYPVCLPFAYEEKTRRESEGEILLFLLLTTIFGYALKSIYYCELLVADIFIACKGEHLSVFRVIHKMASLQTGP